MGIESFLTEPTYSARVPYAQPIEIETGRIVIMLTTNKAELTRDMANRSSVVRIRKRGDDHTFRKFPEGDLLAHVQAKQPRFLGAVFAVVREWHRRGKPRQSDTQHDFRAWASSLGWIVENLLNAAPLLEGHRDVQARIANPAANWLRDVAMAVRSSGKTGRWLRVGQLLEIILEAGIETQGVEPDANTDDEAVFAKATQAIGRKLAKAVGDAEIQVDDVAISRRQSTDDKGRVKNEYQFQTPPAPNRPKVSPYENTGFPYSPYDHQSLLHAGARTHEEGSAPIGDIGGHRGNLAGFAPCDHINPDSWHIVDGAHRCRTCNKFISCVVAASHSDGIGF